MNWKAGSTPKRIPKRGRADIVRLTRAVQPDKLYIPGEKSSPMTPGAKGLSCLVGSILTQSVPWAGNTACRALHRCQSCNDFLAARPLESGV